MKILSNVKRQSLVAACLLVAAFSFTGCANNRPPGNSSSLFQPSFNAADEEAALSAYQQGSGTRPAARQARGLSFGAGPSSCASGGG